MARNELDELKKLLAAEQHRREAAEDLVKSQTLTEYLRACHSLGLAIQVVTGPCATRGQVVNPTGRIYPQKIKPWREFSDRQNNLWSQLSNRNTSSSERAFPSRHQLDYVQRCIEPISSEMGLRYFARDTVENMVSILVEHFNKDETMRGQLSIQGTVSFESHTNMEKLDAGDVSISMESSSMGDFPISSFSTPELQRPCLKARGKGNLADQFCIYRTPNESRTTLVMEYKAPHKLSHNEIASGLQGEIWPNRDVINKEDVGYELWLTTAVITQLFSYMIGKGTQYGYIYTGEAFVFLYIPNDPSMVYYSVCVPNMDVLYNDDGISNLGCTAVGQTFAFVLQSLQATPPPMAWHLATEKLDLWPDERDNNLGSITPSLCPSNQASPSIWNPEHSITSPGSFVSVHEMIAPSLSPSIQESPSIWNPEQSINSPGIIRSVYGTHPRYSTITHDEWIDSRTEDQTNTLFDNSLRSDTHIPMAMAHEMISSTLTKEIHDQLRHIIAGGDSAAEFASKIVSRGSTNIILDKGIFDGNKLIRRRPDQQFQHMNSIYPGVVIEVVLMRLRSDRDLKKLASDFILGSNGQIKAFLGIYINYDRKSLMVSLWRPSYDTRNDERDGVLALKQVISNNVCAKDILIWDLREYPADLLLGDSTSQWVFHQP